LISGFFSSLFADDIHKAAREGDLEKVRSLLQKDPSLLDARDKRDSTPLHFATDGGHVDTIAFLVESGADPNAKDVDGDTPLHWAAYAGRTGTAVFFLEQGADPDVRNLRKMTPLHYAVLQDKPRMIHTLLDHGADIGAQNYEGEAALHMAVLRSGRKMAGVLLGRGADLEQKNNYGRTPLLVAARETGSAPMARFLLEKGANVNAKDESCDTPLILAAWRGFTDQVDLFLDHGAKVEVEGDAGRQMILYATERRLDRLFDCLVEKGADLDQQSDRGGSLLHAAAAGGSTKITARLMEHGHPVAQRDRYGWTPLHYAAYRGRAEVAEQLLAAGAELDARSLSGCSPAFLAKTWGGQEVLDLLMEKGASEELRRFPELTGDYLGQKKPGERPEVFALDIVSSIDGEHGNVVFSPDRTEAYWSSFRIVQDAGYSHCEVMTSRVEDGRWTAPEPAFFAPDTQNRADVPFCSPDGRRIYFLSRRPLEPGGRSGKERVWFVEKTEEGWTDPRAISDAVNKLDIHWQISVTRDYTLYFSSGELGICRSACVNGEYGPPEPVGNAAGDDFSGGSPYIAPDESYLLFNAKRAENPGHRGGLFVTFKDGKGEWTKPVYAGNHLFSDAGSICHQVSHDGKYLFLLSARNGRSNVYWMKADFLHDLRKKVLEQ
jgi:ankyrin repeat protein